MLIGSREASEVGSVTGARAGDEEAHSGILGGQGRHPDDGEDRQGCEYLPHVSAPARVVMARTRPGVRAGVVADPNVRPGTRSGKAPGPFAGREPA